MSVYRTIGPLVLILVTFHFGFEGEALVLIASVSGHCFSFTFCYLTAPFIANKSRRDGLNLH